MQKCGRIRRDPPSVTGGRRSSVFRLPGHGASAGTKAGPLQEAPDYGIFVTISLKHCDPLMFEGKEALLRQGLSINRSAWAVATRMIRRNFVPRSSLRRDWAFSWPWLNRQARLRLPLGLAFEAQRLKSRRDSTSIPSPATGNAN